MLSSDSMKDCLTNQLSFSQVLLTYARVEPTKFQPVRVRVRVRVLGEAGLGSLEKQG